MEAKGAWVSRVLSLIVAIYGLSQYQDTNLMRASLVYLFILSGIWFPKKVSGLSSGKLSWNNTGRLTPPPVLVACLGWVLLLVIVLSQLLLWSWYDSLA